MCRTKSSPLRELDDLTEAATSPRSHHPLVNRISGRFDEIAPAQAPVRAVQSAVPIPPDQASRFRMPLRFSSLISWLSSSILEARSCRNPQFHSQEMLEES